MKQNYDVAVYIWPSYTGKEPRTRIFWPDGIGEWQSVKSAKAKFEGHDWPRKPLWGYLDEADPEVMEMQIDEATKYGINVFIYDWYWFDRRPFLEQCLDEGFLKAKNNEKMKFYLMWANHTATSLWDKRTSERGDVIWLGTVDRKEFEIIAKRVISMYFGKPNYYQIDGKPVFMIYELTNLLEGLGGIQNTREALDWFRGEAVKAGFDGLYLQAVDQGFLGRDYTEGNETYPWGKVIDMLGFDSITHYAFAHYVNMARPYPQVLNDAVSYQTKLKDFCKATYFPHVSLGWDNNPRYESVSYYVTTETTPENIKEGLKYAKEYLDSHPELPARLLTVYSWNEWTETSYLQPDDKNGYGYLEAIREVFGEKADE